MLGPFAQQKGPPKQRENVFEKFQLKLNIPFFSFKNLTSGLVPSNMSKACPIKRNVRTQCGIVHLMSYFSVSVMKYSAKGKKLYFKHSEAYCIPANQSGLKSRDAEYFVLNQFI